MQQQIDLPDDEKRERLETDEKALERVIERLDTVEERSAGSEYGSDLGLAHEKAESALETVRDQLSDIPEWDTSLVSDVVADADSRSAEVRIPDGQNIVVTFEAAHETWRFEVSIHGGNRWFFQRTDDGWEEVWSSK